MISAKDELLDFLIRELDMRGTEVVVFPTAAAHDGLPFHKGVVFYVPAPVAPARAPVAPAPPPVIPAPPPVAP